MSKNGYGDIERGDCDVKLSKLQKIAEVFEIPLSKLVDLSDKGIVNVDFSNQSYTKKSHQNNHVYIGSQSSELTEQKLINDFKEKEMEFKDKEIALLKRSIELIDGKISGVVERTNNSVQEQTNLRT
jgi:transcriptional regulator with XRE-family HTH domain